MVVCHWPSGAEKQQQLAIECLTFLEDAFEGVLLDNTPNGRRDCLLISVCSSSLRRVLLLR